MRCGRCGKPLKNQESVKVGVGPICRKKIEQALEPGMRCFHGFSCLPSVDHIPVLLRRARQRYSVYGIEWDGELANTIIDSLGLNREKVEIDISESFEKEKQEFLSQHGIMNMEDEIKIKRLVLRKKKMCPYGLDCRDPEEALQSVYGLIQKAIDKMEVQPDLPLVDAIDSLIDILRILGFPKEEEHYVKLEKNLRKEFEKKLAEMEAEEVVEDLWKEIEECLES